MLIRLPQALRDWSDRAFEHSLKAELLALEAGILPLQQGVSRGGYVDASNLEITLLSRSETPEQLSVRVGLFFNEVVAGCSCGDDPVVEPVYCELRIRIDKRDAGASFELA